MGLELVNMLTWWQWLVLALVPPAIVLLYFLKLKRRPVEVPSTYFWHKSIEDLHVNTVWQRLRRNLLLLLQLLLLLLVMLAVLRPGWEGTKLLGNRFIFLIDNSASMSAKDVEPSRLEEAKRQVGELIEQMESGDVAMIVSFADTARIEQMFTDDRRQLRRRLEAIQPTHRPTSLGEALRVASGLANPGRSANAQEVRDTQVAEPLPATVYLFSDGKFPDVAGFSLGNLEMVYKPIGSPEASNIGILAFSVGRHESRSSQWQAFARLQNFGTAPATVSVELSKNPAAIGASETAPQVVNAAQLELAPGEAKGVALDLGEMDSGVVTFRAATNDALPLDDEAWAVVNPPRRARVLVVTPGNDPLRFALATESAREIADITIEPPGFLDGEAYQQQADGGNYDLVVFDRCQPQRMPQANTLFLGRTPPEGWAARPKVAMPQIIDIDPAHPVTQYLDLGDVLVADGAPLEPPAGGRVLVDSHAGPMLAIAPRGRFEDAVLGFVLVDEIAGSGGRLEKHIGTNWPIRPSFPVFIFNVLSYLGRSQSALGSGSVRPGQPIALEIPSSTVEPVVRTPSRKEVRLTDGKLGKFTFGDTAELGVYQVSGGQQPLQHFAVNLFHPGESDIRPRPQIQVGHVSVAGQAASVLSRRELWRALLLGGLAVLLIEWYIYTRRVYL